MPEWITSPAALASLCEQVAGASMLGLDTEFMRVHTYWPELALVQLQAGDTTALIDPVPCADLSPLGALLTRTDLPKVMHSASEDLIALAPVAGAPIGALFDTQIAAAFAGHGTGLGYQKLVHTLLGIEIGKGETRSDWLRRPLSAEQLAYAAADVIHLPAMHALLVEQLTTRGWLAACLEDCDRMSAQSTAIDPQPHLSFTSLWKAPVETQARLRRLLRWRDDLARTIDRPRLWLIDNAVASALIEQPPDQPAALTARLTAQRSFPKRELGTLFDLLHSPLQADDVDLPPIPAPLRGEDAQRFNQLRDAVARRAAELDLPAALLGPRRLLEAAVRSRAPNELQGWRGTALADVLTAAN